MILSKGYAYEREQGGCRAQFRLDRGKQRENYVTIVYIYEIKIKGVILTIRFSLYTLVLKVLNFLFCLKKSENLKCHLQCEFRCALFPVWDFRKILPYSYQNHSNYFLEVGSSRWWADGNVSYYLYGIRMRGFQV